MDSSRNISRNTLGNNATLNQGNITHIAFNTASSDRDKKFLRDISKTDPIYDKKRIQTVKGPFLHESFRWVLDHGEFNKWHTEDSGIFWVKGDPGKGKTMLLCGIIDEFEKDPEPSFNLSYFFCQATDSRINTAVSVIGGLIFSLLMRHQRLLSHIQATYEGRLDGPNTWFVLCEIFEIVIQDPDFEGSVFIVDALDECIKDCRGLLRFVIKTSGRVRWLLSSRNEKEIERELRSIKSPRILSLEDNAECISNSVNGYINSRIQDITALDDDEELRSKTLNILAEKARGTYLWVALAVEQLRSIDHWQVEDVLAKIPTGLESLYGLIMNQASDRLNEKGQDACQILLSIITTAVRPLHLKELYTFMSFQWRNFKSAYNLHDIQSITKDCGSILSIKDDIVYFIHQSAKDFIIKEKFPSGLHNQHLEMFQTSTEAMCSSLKYDIYNLEQPEIHKREIQPQDPDPLTPIKYCCLFWGQHLLYGYHPGIECEQKLEAHTILRTFLQKTFLCWVESLALMGYIPQALLTLKKLKCLIESHYRNGENEGHNSQFTKRDWETQELRQFVHDSYEFLLVSKQTVENWPLQLYFSAFSFEQTGSNIRQTFEQTVRTHWGPSPTVASISQSQSSTLLENRVLRLPRDWTPSVALSFGFSPDTSLIFSLNSGGLAVNRVDTGEIEANLKDVDQLSHVAITPDSKHVICVDLYGVIKVWSFEDKCYIQNYSYNMESEKSINDVVAISPKGDLMASLHANLARDSAKLARGKASLARLGANLCDETSTVRIWQTRTVAAVCDCLWGRSKRPLVMFSPNNEILGLTDPSGIRLHCSSTGNLIRYIDIYCNKRGTIWNYNDTHIVISPDSALLGVCEWDGVKLWSIETGECISKIAPKALSMAFPPDWAKSSLVVLQSTRVAIQIRRVDVNRNKPNVEDHDCAFANVVISPESRFVAATHSHNDEISIWSGDTGQQVRVLKGDFGRHYGCPPVFSHDSELLAVGGGNILIWRVTTGEAICLLRHPDSKSSVAVSRVAISIDSNYLIASGEHIYIWRIDTCQCVYEKKVYNIQWRILSSIAISPDSTHVASLTCGVLPGCWSMQILQWRTGQEVTKDGRRGGEPGDKIAFSSNSATLIYISQEKVRLFEVTTGTCLQQFSLQPSRHPTRFNPVKDLIFTSLSVIRNVAWNHWEQFPRASYSYIHKEYHSERDKLKAAWIGRQGKRIFHLPIDFRPDVPNHTEDPILDLSDSLFAFINEAGGVVIIKLPLHSDSQE